MLSYYKTFNAGEDFFARLQNLPPHANDVREIYYLCLSLGFLGQYAFADGPSEVKKLKQALYNQLSGKQGDIRRNYGLLFPEAYQKAVTAARAPDRAKFFWYVVALSTPVVLFIVYFALLRYQADQLIAKIARVEQAPPAAAAIKKSWATSLVEELRGKGVRATEEPDGVRITLATLLFTSGSAQLSIQAQPQINDIVVTVKRYAPDNIIRVEGHASREREADEPRNRKLSEERAHTVAEMFTRSGFRSDRIFAQGLGSTKPLATNDTEQGRSQNRRVEITVRK
jgi:flagellar motor protein MotB